MKKRGGSSKNEKKKKSFYCVPHIKKAKLSEAISLMGY